MPEFRYIAVNDEGEELRGNITARGKQEAMQALHDLSLKTIEVTEANPPPVMPAMTEATSTPVAAPKPAPQPATSETAVRRYAPLLDTVRLYTGWLLAWYALVVALGYYTYARQLPFDIPFVGALFLSSLVFSFLLATFLFLLLSSIHKWLKGGALLGTLLGVIGIAAFFGVRSQF